jgi:hypothetical protein
MLSAITILLFLPPVSNPVEGTRVLPGDQVVLAEHQVQDECSRRRLVHAKHAHAGKAFLRNHLKVVESCSCTYCSGTMSFLSGVKYLK